MGYSKIGVRICSAKPGFVKYKLVLLKKIRFMPDL